MLDEDRNQAFAVLRERFDNPQRDPDEDSWPSELGNCLPLPARGLPVEMFTLQGPIFRRVKLNGVWWRCRPLPGGWSCTSMKDGKVRVLNSLTELYALAYAAPLVGAFASTPAANTPPIEAKTLWRRKASSTLFPLARSSEQEEIPF